MPVRTAPEGQTALCLDIESTFNKHRVCTSCGEGPEREDRVTDVSVCRNMSVPQTD